MWLVTATPVELASILSRRLGLTGALGTVAETVGGEYTGRLVGGLLHGEAKAAAIRALAAREGLDLSRCSAYSDSVNDMPMLTLVGHPHAVNPDMGLRAEARGRGWPVHDFRSGRKATLIALPVAAAPARSPAAWPRASPCTVATPAPSPRTLPPQPRPGGQARPHRGHAKSALDA